MLEKEGLTGKELVAVSSRLKELIHKANGVKQVFARLHQVEQKGKMQAFAEKLDGIEGKLGALIAKLEGQEKNMGQARQMLGTLSGRIDRIKNMVNEGQVAQAKQEVKLLAPVMKEILRLVDDAGGREAVRQELSKQTKPYQIFEKEEGVKDSEDMDD